jgi:N-acetylneuraminic acid mutarotase
MKRIEALFLFITGICLFYGCLNDPEMPDIINGSEPVIQIDTIMDVKANSLNIRASITRQGGSPVSGKGFSWTDGKGDTGSMPVAGKKEGSIIRLDTIITGLEKETTYTFTAYAENGIGKGVSNSKTEQTGNGLGLVRTLKPDSIRGTSVWVGGVILDRGEGEITERGICFYKNKEMREVDSRRPFLLSQADSFVFKLDSLKPNTTYYIKAYATNAFGTFSQSGGETFQTSDGKPSIALFRITGTGFVDATFNAEIEDEGDSLVTVRGVCWSEAPKSYPTIQDDTVVVSSGDKSFSGSIKGLKSYTTYYARAFATNSFGTEYSSNVAEFTTENNMPEVETGEIMFIKDGTAMIKGDIKKTGMGAIDIFGFCYSTSPNPTISGKSTIIPNEGQIEGSFSGSIIGLKGNATYYVKAYLRNTSGFTAYGKQIIVNTDPIFIQMASFTGVRQPNSSASFAIDPIGYMVGGDLGAKYTNELMAYNSIDNRWDNLEPMPGADSERIGQTAVAVNGVAYVLGGVNKAGKRTNSLYRYYPAYNRWESVTAPSGPDSLRSAAGCSIGNDVYFIGGRRDTVMDEVWSFSTSGLSWTRMANFPVKQYSGIAVTINGVVYAGLGLTNLSGTASHNRLWKSADNLNSWTELAPFSNGRIVRGAVVYNNSIYVVDNTASLWMYNIEENTWYEKSELPPTHFRGDAQHCMFLLNEKIYIGLGSSNTTLYQYSPAWDN